MEEYEGEKISIKCFKCYVNILPKNRTPCAYTQTFPNTSVRSVSRKLIKMSLTRKLHIYAVLTKLMPENCTQTHCH